ncbi:phosphatidylinositol transfer protein, partial [Cooperia oncophora]
FLKQYDFFDDETITPGRKLSGIYTYKIYRCKSKMPWILQKLLPEEAFELHEESWNAYPYCKTVLTNPGYMGEDSMLVIESIHLPDNGSSENPLNINRKRDIVFLDICDDTLIGEANYRPESDPKIFKSERTGRGQLREDWMEHTTPLYKAVTVQFKWLGLGSLVEKTIMKQYSKIFSNFHRFVAEP